MQALMRKTSNAFDAALIEAPLPELRDDDWVLVKVAYAGVCGSDIKMLESDAVGQYAKLRPPVITGHEASGTIVAVGPAVTGWAAGDRVVYETTVDNCGVCRFCLSGDWNMCPSRKGLGSSMNGSFAEFVAMPVRNLHKVPDHVDLKTAALAEPLACGVHIVEEAGRVKRGENVLIIGPGPIGMCCGITAKANGARVIMLGTAHSRPRLKVAEEIGLTVLTNDAPDLEKAVMDLCGGELADISIDAAGSQSSFDQALHLVRKMGRIVIGAAPTHKPDPIVLDMTRFYRYQLQMFTAASTRPSGWKAAMQIMAASAGDLARLVGRCFPLSQWEEAFDVTRRKEGFKAMIAFV
ncbi:MAG: alcohol dehydrogenase catalytic domain-containing protein [Desulfovibrio sp.]|nr:alcohol dehydrogenase catalytic domain-containing protein [Desulfovibrio sp.]